MIHQESARLLPQHIQTKPQNQVRPSLSLGQSFPPTQITSRYSYLFGWEKCAGFFLPSSSSFSFQFFPDMALFVFHSSPTLPFSFSLPTNRTKICPAGGGGEGGKKEERVKKPRVNSPIAGQPSLFPPNVGS